MTEAEDLAPVIAAFPAHIVDIVAHGARAWREGRFTEARYTLESAVASATDANEPYLAAQAAHLLACVSANEGSPERARAEHGRVLARCEDLGFLGGIASSEYGLAQIDILAGDLSAGLAALRRAADAYTRGGYKDGALKARSALEQVARESRSLGADADA